MHAVVEALPAVNASFNALAACFVVAGWRAAKAHRRELHGRLMAGALTASTFFLIGYLTRLGLAGTTRFVGEPPLRAVYLFILFTHMALAMVTVPLVLRAVFLAVTKRIDEHRRVVRWALPIWLYVSVTGVMVYFMLYHLSDGAR